MNSFGTTDYALWTGMSSWKMIDICRLGMHLMAPSPLWRCQTPRITSSVRLHIGSHSDILSQQEDATWHCSSLPLVLLQSGSLPFASLHLFVENPLFSLSAASHLYLVSPGVLYNIQTSQMGVILLWFKQDYWVHLCKLWLNSALNPGDLSSRNDNSSLTFKQPPSSFSSTVRITSVRVCAFSLGTSMALAW